jgi:hypothetical protein
MEPINELYNVYINNANYVYTSCDDYIVIMKKYTNTITNEKRECVNEHSHALFRGNNFFVTKIFNKYNPNVTKTKISFKINCLKQINYIVNDVIKVNTYDYNLNNIFTDGIFYYKTIEPAFYSKNIIGEHKSWHPDGKIKAQGILYDNKKIGLWKYNDINGKIYEKTYDTSTNNITVTKCISLFCSCITMNIN